MVRHMFAAVALTGFVLAIQPSPAAAQTSEGSPAASQHKPMKKMGQRSGMAKRMAKPGHQMDNIADKLNACQQRAEGERKMCMDQATH